MNQYKNRDKLNESFALFIKEIRTERGLTQAELAESLEIDTQHMSKIETAKKNVTLDLFLKFCDHFNINPITAFTIVYKNYETSCSIGNVDSNEFIASQINDLSLSKKIVVMEIIEKLKEL